MFPLDVEGGGKKKEREKKVAAFSMRCLSFVCSFPVVTGEEARPALCFNAERGQASDAKATTILAGCSLRGNMRCVGLSDDAFVAPCARFPLRSPHSGTL